MAGEAATTGVDTGDTGGDADTGAQDTGDQSTDTSSTVLTGSEGATGDNSADAGAAGAADGADGDTDSAGTANAGEGQTEPPEAYADFSLPDGVELDSATLESVAPLMKEAGLSQESAQKFVDWYAERVQADAQRQVDAFNQLTGDWRTQSENDSEFGGEKFEESVATARAAIDKFGTPELKQLLEDHGVGNHPEVVRFMVRVGSLTKEDNPGETGANVSPAQDRVSRM